jgi:hypothetical protein
MNKFVSHGIVALAGAIIGWFACSQYIKYEMLSAFTSTIGRLTAEPTSPAYISTFKPSPETEAILSSVTLDDIRVASEPNLFMTSLQATAKNNGKKTVAGISTSYKLVSPGREVPWAEGSRVYFSVEGGLAPNESRAIVSYESSLSALKRAMNEHPDAVLSVSINDLDGANKTSLLPH